MTNVAQIKAIEPVTVEFTLKDEKKHSVRYDASSDDPAVTSAYVMKTALPRPYPKKFTMTLNFS